MKQLTLATAGFERYAKGSPTAYTPEGQTRRRSVQSTTTTGYARWETGASRLNWDENSQSRPNPKYALTVARIFDPLHGEWWVSW